MIDTLARACGSALLDVHTDADHHRSVFTLAGPGERDAFDAASRLAEAVAEAIDIREHDGVHPRLGALDVAPFVALGNRPEDAVAAARAFADWVWRALDVPVFLYGDAHPDHRSLPEVRHDAFVRCQPDLGPPEPHPRLGAVAVGARPPLVAVNCWLDDDDLTLADSIARAVRERDGGLRGVRALGLELASRGAVQVSMNLVELEATGVERACTEVRRLAQASGREVTKVEVVGLLPCAELARCSEPFRAWAGFDDGLTIEARLAALTS